MDPPTAGIGKGDRELEVVCQICGAKASVSKWEPEYKEVREGKSPPYICPSCQDRIRAEAQRQERP